MEEMDKAEFPLVVVYPSICALSTGASICDSGWKGLVKAVLSVAASPLRVYYTAFVNDPLKPNRMSADMTDPLPDMSFTPALYHTSRGTAHIDMLVLHYTDGPSLEECVSIFRDPDRRVSCHYIVGLDRAVRQMVRDEDCAWHCGVSQWRGRDGCNPWSLGIEVVNCGRLEKRNGQFFRWPEEYTTPYTGLPPVWLEGNWWAPYPPDQFEQVTNLSRRLVEGYRIPLVNIVRHSDIAPDRKIDPGPAFPWFEFTARMADAINARW